jgi:hypothetical protein
VTEAGRERRTLRERDNNDRLSQQGAGRGTERSLPTDRARGLDPYRAWLETPKNLSSRALADASGLVRVCDRDGTIHAWAERSDVDDMLDQGWTLA